MAASVKKDDERRTTIVSTDDNEVVRSGLRTRLEREPDMEVLAETGDVRATQPDLLVSDLSEREVEVLRLIALGHTNSAIGEQLYLSVRTVESHRAHIQQKLHRSTRAELVRFALDHGMLNTPAAAERERD